MLGLPQMAEQLPLRKCPKLKAVTGIFTDIACAESCAGCPKNLTHQAAVILSDLVQTGNLLALDAKRQIRPLVPSDKDAQRAIDLALADSTRLQATYGRLESDDRPTPPSEQLSKQIAANPLNYMIFGPWVGEFGWEVAMFQAMVRLVIARQRAQNRKITNVVITRINSQALYYDCADYIYWHDTPTNQAITWNVKSTEYKGPTFPPERYWHRSRQYPVMWSNYYPGLFRVFGTRDSWYTSKFAAPQYDIVLAIRWRVESGPERNWLVKYWTRLLKMLEPLGLKVAAIGTKDGAAPPPAAWVDDLRGNELGQVMAILNRATICVGPSSGPMHLAVLCGCPIVCWCHRNAALQYTPGGTANPFCTPLVRPGDHSVDIETVYRCVCQALDRWIDRKPMEEKLVLRPGVP